MPTEFTAAFAAGLRRSIRPGAVKLRDFVQGKPSARKLMAEVKSVEDLVGRGYDRLHAIYTNGENYLSVFAELACRLREFRSYNDVVAQAQDTYVPGWPPMSPVSGSFYSGWALLDVPAGPAGETLCTCAVDVGRALGVSAEFLTTLEVMGESSMGLYRHLGWRDGVVGLRDILDDRVYPCIVPSGYRGREGELWYARLLPPLDPSFDYGDVVTSPYVLVDTTEADWLAFFDRQERTLPPAATPEERILRRRALLKLGPDPNYWSEYIFLGYHNASDSAIFLCGIPDLPESLPHAERDDD